MIKNVGATLLVKDWQLLVAQRPNFDPLSGLWEFPGGKVEIGESLPECIRREMREEFGVEVSVAAFFADSVYHYERGSIRLLSYWATLTSGELLPVFHSAFEWVQLGELQNYSFAPADISIVDRLVRERPCLLR